MSPTQLSLALLRRQGWTVAIVERWNAHAHIRQDLFGFADLLAMQPGFGFIAIQCCAASSNSKRVDKIKAEPRARTFIESQGKVYVHSWAKRGPRGKAKHWSVSETEIELKDFEP